MTNPTSQRRPNALLDPTRQPDGTVPVHCTYCDRWIMWCAPPAPPCRVLCRVCQQGGSR